MVDIADIVQQLESKLSISFERKDHIWNVIEGILPGHTAEAAEKLRIFALLGDSLINCLVRERIITQQFIIGKERRTWFTYAVSNAIFAEVLKDYEVLECIDFRYAKPMSKRRRHDLGTFFEGIVAALYLDQGLEAVKEFLDIVLFSNICRYGEHILNIDPMAFLKSICIKHFGKQPRYYISERPCNGNGHYEITVKFANMRIPGVGSTYSAARRNAALNALDSLPEQLKVLKKLN